MSEFIYHLGAFVFAAAGAGAVFALVDLIEGVKK